MIENKPDITLNDFAYGILDKKFSPTLSHLTWANNLIISDEHYLKIRKGSRLLSHNFEKPITNLHSFDDLFLLKCTEDEISVDDLKAKLWDDNENGVVNLTEFRDHFILTSTNFSTPRKVEFDKDTQTFDVSSAGLPKPNIEFIPTDGVELESEVERLVFDPEIKIGTDLSSLSTTLTGVETLNGSYPFTNNHEFADLAGSFFAQTSTSETTSESRTITLDRLRVSKSRVYNNPDGSDGDIYGWISSELQNAGVRFTISLAETGSITVNTSDLDDRGSIDTSGTSSSSRGYDAPDGLLGVIFWNETNGDHRFAYIYETANLSNSSGDPDVTTMDFFDSNDNECIGRGFANISLTSGFIVAGCRITNDEVDSGTTEFKFDTNGGSSYTDTYSYTDTDTTLTTGTAEFTINFPEAISTIQNQFVIEGEIGLSNNEPADGNKDGIINFDSSTFPTFSTAIENFSNAPSTNKFAILYSPSEATFYVNGSEIQRFSLDDEVELNNFKISTMDGNVGIRNVDIFLNSNFTEQEVKIKSEQTARTALDTALYRVAFLYRRRFSVREVSELGVENEITDFIDISESREFGVLSTRDQLASFRVKGFKSVQEPDDIYDNSNIMLEIYASTFTDPIVKKVKEIQVNDEDTVEKVPLNRRPFIGESYFYQNPATPQRARPPKAKYIHSVGGYTFYGNVEGSPNTLYQSLSNDPDSVPPSFFNIFDEEIVGISSSRGLPIVFCTNKVYVINSVINDLGVGEIQTQEIDANARCLSHKSLVKYKDRVIFLGERGVYSTDGNVVNFLSEHCNTFLWTNLIKPALALPRHRKELISGSYVQSDNKIYWSFPFGKDEAISNVRGMTLDLQFGFTRNMPITTFGSEVDRIRWNTIVEFDDTLYRGDHLGNVFKYTYEKKSDPIPFGSTPSSWKEQDIGWSLRGNDFKLQEGHKSLHIHSIAGSFLGSGLMEIRPRIYGNSQRAFNLPVFSNGKPVSSPFSLNWDSTPGIFRRNNKLPKFASFMYSGSPGFSSVKKIVAKSDPENMIELALEEEGEGVYSMDLSSSNYEIKPNELDSISVVDGLSNVDLKVIGVNGTRAYLEPPKGITISNSTFNMWSIKHLRTALDFSIIDFGFLVDGVHLETSPDGAVR